jgi:dienelactone hydrolase
MHWQAAYSDLMGPHALGTATLSIRAQAGDGSSSKLRAQLWYPTDQAKRTKLHSLVQLIKRLRHPRWPRAWHGAPPSSALGKLPLIMYVPDAAGSHDENTFMLANLASHGFVLAAIHDPFVRRVPVFGTNASAEQPEKVEPASVSRGIKTATQLLDALHNLDKDDRAVWANRLDLTNVGILGYALGGGVAAEATLSDQRYVAAANLGGPISARLVTVPYLVLLGDLSATDPSTNLRTSRNAREVLHHRRARHQAALPKSHVMEIAGAQREYFSDQKSFSSPLSVTRTASLGRHRTRTILNAYTVAFFNTYLQNGKHPLMYVNHSPYAEVKFLASMSSRRIHRAPAARQ